MGRTLGAGEIRRMIAADNVVKAYRSRAASDNWAQWAQKNPEMSRLLNAVIKLAEEMENG